MSFHINKCFHWIFSLKFHWIYSSLGNILCLWYHSFYNEMWDIRSAFVSLVRYNFLCIVISVECILMYITAFVTILNWVLIFHDIFYLIFIKESFVCLFIFYPATVWTTLSDPISFSWLIFTFFQKIIFQVFNVTFSSTIAEVNFSQHLYAHHMDSTINTVLYLLYHILLIYTFFPLMNITWILKYL